MTISSLCEILNENNKRCQDNSISYFSKYLRNEKYYFKPFYEKFILSAKDLNFEFYQHDYSNHDENSLDENDHSDEETEDQSKLTTTITAITEYDEDTSIGSDIDQSTELHGGFGIADISIRYDKGSCLIYGNGSSNVGSRELSTIIVRELKMGRYLYDLPILLKKKDYQADMSLNCLLNIYYDCQEKCGCYYEDRIIRTILRDYDLGQSCDELLIQLRKDSPMVVDDNPSDEMFYYPDKFLSHVFVCYYQSDKRSGIKVGRVISVVIIVKWSHYSYTRLSFEAVSSLGLDIYSKIYGYFLEYVCVHGVRSERPERRPSSSLSLIQYFSTASGRRLSRKPTTVNGRKFYFDAPIIKSMLEWYQEQNIYSNQLGFTNANYRVYGQHLSMSPIDSMLIVWVKFCNEMDNVILPKIIFYKKILGFVGRKPFISSVDRLKPNIEQLHRFVNRGFDLVKLLRVWKHKQQDQIVVFTFIHSPMNGFSSNTHLLVVIIDDSIRLFDSYSSFKDLTDCGPLKYIIEEGRLTKLKRFILNGDQKNDFSCFWRACYFLEHVIKGGVYKNLPWKQA